MCTMRSHYSVHQRIKCCQCMEQWWKVTIACVSLWVCCIRYFPSTGYLENNLAQNAFGLFKAIKTPNEIVTNLFFNACAQLRTNEAFQLVKEVSKQMPKSFHSNPRLMTSLLDALMKCGDVKHAESLFHRSTNKVLPMYGAMMKGKDYFYHFTRILTNNISLLQVI